MKVQGPGNRPLVRVDSLTCGEVFSLPPAGGYYHRGPQIQTGEGRVVAYRLDQVGEQHVPADTLVCHFPRAVLILEP